MTKGERRKRTCLRVGEARASCTRKCPQEKRPGQEQVLKLPIWLLKQVLPFNNGSINVQGQSLTGSGTPRHLGSQELRQAPTPLSTPCCSLVLPLRRAQASPDPCTQLACTLSPQGAFFFSCCSNRQSPRELGFSLLKGSEKAGPAQPGQSCSPKMFSFRHFPVPQNVLLPIIL